MGIDTVTCNVNKIYAEYIRLPYCLKRFIYIAVLFLLILLLLLQVLLYIDWRTLVFQTP